MRIVFFGTPAFAVPSLATLLLGSDAVVGVVCQPDKPAGRGRQLAVPAVKELAQQHGVPVLQPDKLRAPASIDALRHWNPELIVVAAYGRILPASILDLPVHGCINVHASLLPKYRGAAPIQWAILNGEHETGITIMRMNERMDAGDILLQRATAIGPDETYGELQTRLAHLGASVLSDALAGLRAGTLVGRPQDEAQATPAPMIHKDDGRIRWQEPAAAIARRVRAFNPWPSAFTSMDGKLLKVHRARQVPDSVATLPPGTVTRTGHQLAVATGDGELALLEVQLEGRRRLSAAEFARGALRVGAVLGEPHRP